jgi:acid phosphatase (class A)
MVDVMYTARMMRKIPVLLLSLMLLAALALAGKGHYLSPGQVDLSRLLAPPPANDSLRTRAEIETMLSLQLGRTPAQEAAARADREMSPFPFADVLGPRFVKDKLPNTAVFFENVRSDQRLFVSPAKKHFNRPRPYVLDRNVEPSLSRPHNQSYPSGHSTWGHLAGIILANMVPEKAAQLYERAELYASQRVVGGVHYPSDVEAGKIAAAVIASALFQNPAFQEDFAKAKTEVRGVLHLDTSAASTGQ